MNTDYKFYDLTNRNMLNIYLNRTEEKIEMRLFLVMNWWWWLKYPKLEEAIKESSQFIRDEKKVLPSMRALQLAGPAAEVNNARYTIVVFLWITLQVLVKLCFYYWGTGVGYSVQRHHVAQLPAITKPGKKKNLLSRRFYYDAAVKVLMRSYLEGKFLPTFDFRAVRQRCTIGYSWR
jgi:ribonucleoside-diphosphate reductase alpha chain